MLHLFKCVVLVSKGLECDCCVDVSRIHEDVFARDEAHARELLKNFDRYAEVGVELLEDCGPVEKVENPGIIVTGHPDSIYRGYYGKAPVVADKSTTVDRT